MSGIEGASGDQAKENDTERRIHLNKENGFVPAVGHFLVHPRSDDFGIGLEKTINGIPNTHRGNFFRIKKEN